MAGRDAIDWDGLIAWVVSGTGWTWEHVEQCVTLPQVNALGAYWEALPPPAVQLKRISLYLGLPDTKKTPPTHAQTSEDALREAMAAGIPVQEGRPDDPMLDLVGW